jgi:hypothetical protein
VSAPKDTVTTAAHDRPPPVRELERRLALGAMPGRFDPAELDELPEPVRRYFSRAIEPGAPLCRAARLRMRGHLRLGTRWLPFRAREVLAPRNGFVWTARVAGVIAGSDHYVDGQGALEWKLLGLIRVMRAGGPDVTRSAAGRGAAEGVWVPSALLPRFGVEWTAESDIHLVARHRIDGVDITMHCDVDDDGRLRSIAFDRWGDPDNTGSYGLHRFGMDVARHQMFGPFTIPASGSAGWFHGSDRWAEGAFFRYELTAHEAEPERTTTE